jgi:hypothetical protein
MHRRHTIPGQARGPHTLDAVRTHKPLTNTLTVGVAASPDRALSALGELDLLAPAIRALGALGLTDCVTRTSDGLVWRTEGSRGQIDVQVRARVVPEAEDACALTLTTRFSAADKPTHERLLDAWPLVGPLAETLVKRAARTVQSHARSDRFDETTAIDAYARAA